MRSALLAATLGALPVVLAALPVAASDSPSANIVRAALPPGAIEHILVINLENENYSATFGPTSPATYLNGTLLKQGELIPNYFATSHVSLGNYISEVSGQGTNPTLNNDCIDLTTLTKPPVLGAFTDVLPGTDSLDTVQFPGQVPLGDLGPFLVQQEPEDHLLLVGENIGVLDLQQWQWYLPVTIIVDIDRVQSLQGTDQQRRCAHDPGASGDVENGDLLVLRSEFRDRLLDLHRRGYQVERVRDRVG